MSEIVITTFDWVPEAPRGYVRDIRARWALEEAGLPYRIEATSSRERSAAHYEAQPFGQVPWLTDGDVTVFESGAILLYIGEKSAKILPRDPKARATVTSWLFAALNSVDPVNYAVGQLNRMENLTDLVAKEKFQELLSKRLERMEAVLADREWLAGDFSIADIAMVDVFRNINRRNALDAFPNCRAYLLRATSRPAFIKAYDDQMAHYQRAQ